MILSSGLKSLRGAPMTGAGGMIQDPSVIPPPSYGASSAAGVLINDHAALTIPTYFACIQLITDTIAALPRAAYRRPVGSPVRVQIDPPPAIVREPFVDLTWREAMGQILVSLLTRGNAYLEIIRRDPILGWPTTLNLLAPTAVRVAVEKGELCYYSAFSGSKYESDSIVHIRGMMLPGSRMGLAPVELHARTLGLSIAAEQYGGRFFSQGASVAGVLSSQDPLSKEEARDLKQEFMAWHSGTANAHLPLVLSGGLAYDSMVIPPDQAQFLATRDFGRGEVATMFGVPPHMVGDTDKATSWGKGIEDQEISFVTHTLMRWLSRLEDAWQQKLLPRGNYLRFNLEGLLRTDTLTRYQSYVLARTIGFKNNDEIRALEDLPPIPDGGGSSYSQPMNAPTPAQIVGAPKPGGASDAD